MAAPRSDQPPSLSKVLKEERGEYEDCTPCRVIGATAFIGLGTYTYFSGHYQLRQQQTKIINSGSSLGLKTRGASITVMSLGLVGLGLYRLVN